MNFNFLQDLEPVNEETVKEWEKEQREIEINNNLMHFLPYNADSQTFDTFQITNEKEQKLLDFVKQYAKDVADGQFKSLVLRGSCGVGKTHLSYATMRYVMENGINHKTRKYTVNGFTGEEVFEWPKIAKYFLIPQLCDRYTSAMSFTTKETVDDVIKDVVSADLICIDEVARGNKYESEIMYRIVNNCWVHKIPLMIATNASQAEFMQVLGKASIDRLKDSVITFNLEGLQSHRGFNF